MFSNRTVNPSPNRTSIKEANDHLQLLHQRVMELETATQEQAENLKKKEDIFQATVKSITELKDVEIHELNTVIEQLRDRLRKLESLVKEKDQQIDHLTQRCNIAEDIATYTPSVEKLLNAMKKIPYKSKHGVSKPKSKFNRSYNSRKSVSYLDSSHNDALNSIDVHNSVPNQPFADLRIGRSFNINSNFSLSEDDEPSEIL